MKPIRRLTTKSNKTKFIIPILLMLLLISCSDNDSLSTKDLLPTDVPSSNNNNEAAVDHDELLTLKEFDVNFTFDGSDFTKYHAIRIGEYYWLDKNLHNYAPKTQWSGERGDEINYPMTQARLDKYMSTINIDKNLYQVNIDDFNYWYGLHYHWYSASYINEYGKIYISGKPQSGWGLPSIDDAKQLFAMAVSYLDPYIDGHTVSYGLGAHSGDNPLAYDIDQVAWNNPYRTHWFGLSESVATGDDNLNFKLMPAGTKLNADNDPWENGIGGTHYGDKGDVYHLFYTAGLWLKGHNMVYLHDDITFIPESFHWHSIRLTRRLTDKELGYKLYKNDSKKDIIKLGLNDTPPVDYTELEPGYLRGYYIKFILDKATPIMTPQEIYDRVAKYTK